MSDATALTATPGRVYLTPRGYRVRATALRARGQIALERLGDVPMGCARTVWVPESQALTLAPEEQAAAHIQSGQWAEHPAVLEAARLLGWSPHA
jgi:hypothetical protein